MPLKKRAEKRCILIANGIANFLHAAMIAFQEALRGGNAEFLQISQRTVAGRLFEAPHKIAQAHSGAPCVSFERKIAVKIFVQPFLSRGDAGVGMFGFEGHDGKARLPGARRLNEQRFGALDGDFVAAVFLDEIQTQIKRGMNAATAVEAAVLGDHKFRHPANPGIFLAEGFGQRPVGGGALPIEQSGGGNETDTGADAGNRYAAFVPAAQPGNYRGIAFQHVIEAEAGGGDKNEVGIANLVEGGLRAYLDSAVAMHGASVRGSGSDPKARSLALAGKDIPQAAGMAKHFHRTNGRGGKGLVEEGDGDIKHGSLGWTAEEWNGLNTHAGWHIRHLVATGAAPYPASVVNPSGHARREQMKKYIIERDIPKVGTLEREQLKQAACTSNQALRQLGPDIQWLESFVAADKTFCVYLAKDEAIIRKHAEISGFPATRITEISKTIDPSTAG